MKKHQSLTFTRMNPLNKLAGCKELRKQASKILFIVSAPDRRLQRLDEFRYDASSPNSVKFHEMLRQFSKFFGANNCISYDINYSIDSIIGQVEDIPQEILQKYDILFVTGGHGMVDQLSGKPKDFNNLKKSDANKLFLKLEEKNAKFSAIMLDFCFSISWSEELKPLLKEEGVILGNNITASDIMFESLKEALAASDSKYLYWEYAKNCLGFNMPIELVENLDEKVKKQSIAERTVNNFKEKAIKEHKDWEKYVREKKVEKFFSPIAELISASLFNRHQLDDHFSSLVLYDKKTNTIFCKNCPKELKECVLRLHKAVAVKFFSMGATLTKVNVEYLKIKEHNLIENLSKSANLVHLPNDEFYLKLQTRLDYSFSDNLKTVNAKKV